MLIKESFYNRIHITWFHWQFLELILEGLNTRSRITCGSKHRTWKLQEGTFWSDVDFLHLDNGGVGRATRPPPTPSHSIPHPYPHRRYPVAPTTCCIQCCPNALGLKEGLEYTGWGRLGKAHTGLSHLSKLRTVHLLEDLSKEWHYKILSCI